MGMAMAMAMARVEAEAKGWAAADWRAAALAQGALAYIDAWSRSSKAIAPVANDGTRMTIAIAAATPAPASSASICADFSARNNVPSPSRSFGVRRNAV